MLKLTHWKYLNLLTILLNILTLRNKYPKGHNNYMLYTEIGNGIFGIVCRDICRGYKTK